MRLAVVGSTALGGPRSRRIITDAIRRFGATSIISGGADGIDKLAASIGRELGLKVDERVPEVRGWEDRDGKKGFKSRNMEIAKNCDVLIRISWNPIEQQKVTGKKPTYGSGWTRDRAAERKIPTEESALTLAEDAQ